MLRILDKLLLFAMCSCLIFQLEGDYRRVVIFIIGLIVAALTLYIEPESHWRIADSNGSIVPNRAGLYLFAAAGVF